MATNDKIKATWTKLSRTDANKVSCLEAAHCMFWSKTNTKTVHDTPVKALVMLQMRFDGLIGFPGGLVDAGEDVVTGLNRELEEELGLDTSLIKIEDSDWVSAVHRVQRKTDDAGKEEIFDELLCHFFAKEITEEEYIALEREQLSAREWGKECFGVIRGPIYEIKSSSQCNRRRVPGRGLGWFLSHSFVACARTQMLDALQQNNILTTDEVESMLKAAENPLLRRFVNQ